MNLTEYALIVAGGKGTRIKSHTPKQFLLLHGLPILMHTINAFFQYSDKITVIVVLPADDFDTWKTLCREHNFTKPLILQPGGETRFQSVRNGLDQIQEKGLVAIHDGVRPLVSPEIIGTSFRLAAIHQSAVAAVQLKESIRMTAQESSQGSTMAVERSKFRMIQTPQTFRTDLIKTAYTLDEDQGLTDDASVAERSGHAITLFEGSYTNIKITTPEDLVIAEALMNTGRK